MMRIAISWIAIFSFGLSYPCGAFAQSRNVAPERWQAVDKSMSDLLLEGYRPVSVIAPSAHLRIYFLSSGSLLAKMHGRGHANAASAATAPVAVSPAAGVNPTPAARPGCGGVRSWQLHAGDRSDLRVLPPLQIPMMRGATCASRCDDWFVASLL